MEKFQFKCRECDRDITWQSNIAFTPERLVEIKFKGLCSDCEAK